MKWYILICNIFVMFHFHITIPFLRESLIYLNLSQNAFWQLTVIVQYNKFIYITAADICVGHENSWLQHPLACHKGIACWGPGQPPRPDDNICLSDKVFNPILHQCLDSVTNCTMTTVVPDGCLTDPCQNGGVCSIPNTKDIDFLCNCTTNYMGTFCEIGILFILFSRKMIIICVILCKLLENVLFSN